MIIDTAKIVNSLIKTLSSKALSSETSLPETLLLETSVETTNSLMATHNQSEQQRALTRVISRIRESLDLNVIFETTATEVRELLDADRVAVFQFDPSRNWEGEFISESVKPEFRSALAAKVYDHCFGPNYAAFYEAGRMQVVDDILNANLSPCHVDILGQFQVRSNLVVPLLRVGKLWGLLCVHQCDRPRSWTESEIEFVRQVSEHLGVALQHNQLLEDARYQTEQQKALTSVINRIRESLDLETIFNTTAIELRQLLKADRVGLFRFIPDRNWEGEFIAEDVAPNWKSALNAKVYDHCFGENFAGNYLEGQVQAIADIQTAGLSDCHIQILDQFQIRANLVVPVRLGETLWGLLCVHQCEAPRNWQDSEIEFIRQIANQLGVALRQDRVVQKVQEQSAQLAQAAERERAMNRQQLLTSTIEKIRTSLDLDIVFSSTTNAVRDLLNVERVAIYQFNKDWSGKFVADSIKDNGSDLKIPPLLNSIMLGQADETGEYPRNETFVPIPQGEKLWGLLVAYQNSQPRYWQNEDVNLLAQVGVQLGVAIQQAELLAQTQQQALQLSQTIAELQQTQTQLIQGEKMASLGQLVAGIAHEINNPVNFIHGNLIHVEQYTQDLLKTVEIYQTLYPDSNVVLNAAHDVMDLAFVIEDLPKTIASMQLGADRIREIVLSLRNFSRMDESDSKEVDLHDGLDSTLLILGHRLKANGRQRAIVIDKHYADLKLVECYPAQLNQVFMNILSNGIDALEEITEQDPDFMPQITITTKYLDSNQITITIVDNGPGMSEEVRSRIFDPFFTTKQPGKGTGLGLPICYQIIHEKHGGTLECQSIPGSGTTFMITIPATVAREN